MPFVRSKDGEKQGVLRAAELMMVSCRTAPKSGGVDDIQTLLVTGDEKDKIAKEMEKKVIWGGPHVTILPEITIQHPLVDGGVIGEAEHSFPELVEYFEGNGINPGDDIIIDLPPVVWKSGEIVKVIARGTVSKSEFK